MGKDKSFERMTKCPKCGYGNQEHNVKIYGTCKRCGIVLDGRAKLEYEMYTKLRLWRDKRR